MEWVWRPELLLKEHILYPPWKLSQKMVRLSKWIALKWSLLCFNHASMFGKWAHSAESNISSVLAFMEKNIKLKDLKRGQDTYHSKKNEHIAFRCNFQKIACNFSFMTSCVPVYHRQACSLFLLPHYSGEMMGPRLPQTCCLSEEVVIQRCLVYGLHYLATFEMFLVLHWFHALLSIDPRTHVIL